MIVKTVKILILVTWLVMLGLLIERTYLRPTSVIALDVITEEGIRSGEEWFGIYQQKRKIGYAHTSIIREGDAYHISEESVMDILALERVQRIHTSISAYATKNFQLKYFDFSLLSEQSSMHIKGAVVGKKLVLDIDTAGQTRKDSIPIREPIYLTPNVRPALVLLGLEPGKRYRFPVFNPATMSTDDAFITVESRETIKVGDAEQTVYKLRESFQGMDAFSWISDDGETIKEESPLGYTLLRETQTEAMRLDQRGPAVDIISLVKIPSRPIADSAQVLSLRAKLSGMPPDRFDLDGGRQRWSGGIIEVHAAQALQSYRLPYAGSDHADDLQPTALIQSDDPTIRKQMEAIVGSRTDAVDAAKKITSWVYNTLEKEPVVSIPSAVEILKQRVGDCNEHTTLFTALTRAAGIPTRMAAGIVYMKDGFYYHAWPEVWLGRWVAVDPTFNQFPADATHIRFISGDLGRQADILKLVGKLSVDVLETAK